MSRQTPNIDIRPDQWEIVRTILQEHIPGLEVWAFGSRAKWTAKEYSDLDLAIITDTPLPLETSAALNEAFSESDLPWKVDVVDWAATGEDFRRVIETQKTVLSPADTQKNSSTNALTTSTGDVTPPPGWQRTTLEHAFHINPFRPIKRGTVTPFIPMDALSAHTRKPERIERREFTGSGTRFQNGDTLIARITPCLENGKTVHISELNKNSIGHGSTEYIILAGKQGISDNLYGYYIARSQAFRDYAISRMEGTSGRQRVPASAAAAYPFNLPPLQEQRAIAHILGTLDDKIELNRRMNETLEAMARALFKAWFVDFEPVRAKMEGRWKRGQSLPGLPAHLYDAFPDQLVEYGDIQIPDNWRVSAIGDEVTVVGGSTPSTKEPAYWNGSHHWATPKDLSSLRFPVLLDTARKISNSGLEKISSGLLPKGTILLSSRAPIGYLAITEIPTAINQGFIAIRCKESLSNIFLLQWCHHNMDRIIGNANGSTFQEISKSNFRPIPIIVPPRTIINIFNNIAKTWHQRMADNERESLSLVTLRSTLLPKLISGELRPPDPEQFLQGAGLS
ncbi:MAG: restriction endonuclease subunit S [Lautropia sp.]|nr:restriction endonuclease subunit S [Lautropia sp.]